MDELAKQPAPSVECPPHRVAPLKLHELGRLIFVQGIAQRPLAGSRFLDGFTALRIGIIACRDLPFFVLGHAARIGDTNPRPRPERNPGAFAAPEPDQQ